MEEQHRKVVINVDADKGYFYLDAINQYEIKYLYGEGYRKTLQFDLYGQKRYWLVKLGLKESAEHFLLVNLITEYLKDEQGFLVSNYRTKMPDIIFELKNRKIAIEVETGKNLRNNRKQFLEKVEWLNENFGDNWFFVVTNRDLVKKYKKYAKTFTRKNVIKAIEWYVKKSVNSSMSKFKNFD
jgi:DNA-directed RNA polymerase subunit L